MNHKLLTLGFLVCLLASCAHQGIRQPVNARTPVSTDNDASRSPRWIAFHAPALREALQPLASHRRAQGYQVVLIPTTSAESPQVAEWTTRLRRAPRSRDAVLLVGTSSATAAAHGCLLAAPDGTRGRMAGRPADNLLALDPPSAWPQLALGRIPASSPSELRDMVGKILRHEASLRAGQNDVFCIIANPMAGQDSSRLADTFIRGESRRMLRPIHPAWQLRGAADVAGHPFETTGSDYTRRITDAFNAPNRVIAFFGHSNSSGIHSLGKSHLTPGFWNHTPPTATQGLFLTCGCGALESPGAYGVRAIRSRQGPAAVIGSSGISYAAIGALAGRGLVDAMESPGGPATVGQWWMAVQNAIASTPLSRSSFLLYDRVDGSSGETALLEQRREHLEMWALLGDPAMRMAP